MNAGSPTLVVSGLTQLCAERRVVDDLSFSAGPARRSRWSDPTAPA
jgi:hypothetical protein